MLVGRAESVRYPIPGRKFLNRKICMLQTGGEEICKDHVAYPVCGSAEIWPSPPKAGRDDRPDAARLPAAGLPVAAHTVTIFIA